MKNKRIKGLVALTIVLLAFSTNTATVVLADPVDTTEETTTSTESESESKESKEIAKRIKEITNSNGTTAEKAKELLDVYSEQISKSQEISNTMSLLAVEQETKDSDLKEKNKELDKAEKELASKQKDLESKQKEVDKSKSDLESIKKEIEDLQSRITSTQEVMSERMRDIQVNGYTTNNLLAVLFSSESINDVIQRIMAMNKIKEADNTLRDSLASDKEKQEALESKQKKVLTTQTNSKNDIEKLVEEMSESKENIEKEKKTIEDELKELKKAQEEYKERSDEATNSLSSISTEMNSVISGMLDLDSELTELKEKLDPEKDKEQITEIEKLQAQIASIRAEQEALATKSVSGTSIPISEASYTESQKKIIDTAKTQLGVAYVWGGTAWNSGLDCSGFTMNVYKRALGIDIGRVTTQQQYSGKEVPLSDIQAGDLIFWNEPTTHVALYVGGGYYIHAPKPGDVVKYSNYNISSATHIRRIIDIEK